jgi:hypothetical protein
MPKDATKNVDRYKVGGGHLNEYEFEQEKTADRKQRSAGKKSQSVASPGNAASNKSPQDAASKASPRTNATKKSPKKK